MDGERYQKDNANFHGEEAEVRSTGSVFHANKAAFFVGDKPRGGFKITATIGLAQTGPTVDIKSGVYRKNAAAFYDDEKFEIESQGT